MTLCIGCIYVADAQQSFTQRLQQAKQGEGKITVTQDPTIDALVNGPSHTINTQKQTEKKETKTATNTNQDKKTDSRAHLAERTDTVNLDSPGELQKKIIRGTKVSGYRVQVFAGGNSRNDRVKAERIGSEIKALFPEVPVYVHFYSPRWICRMGNYRTYEEAHEVLERVKRNGYQSAIIVKGKITVQYP